MADPVVVGYQSTRLGRGPGCVAAGRARLECFAAWQGWRLGRVFVDEDAGRPQAAYFRTIVAARSPDVAGVVVPSLRDLARDPVVACVVRARMERQAGVAVVVVESGESGESAGARHGPRIGFEVLSVAGRVVPVTVRLWRGAVEVSADGRDVAVLDRERLRGWLAIPVGPLIGGGVRLDPLADQGIAVTIAAAPRPGTVEAMAAGASGGGPAALVDQWRLGVRTVVILRAWV